MEFSNIHIGLVIKHFSGELSEAEKKKLFEWVYSNTENEKLFYNLKDVWETAKYESITKNVQTDDEWDKFIVNAIKEESNNYKRKLVSMQAVKKALQIAAVILITFGLGFFVNNLIPENQEYTTVNVPYGAKSQIELADGSKVWINSGSKLTYPTRLNEKEVNLFLEGEAYFDIVKDKGRKLNVKTSTLSIEVLGTAFNVRSYKDEDIVETTLVRGKISILGNVGSKSIEQPILLKPNEQAILVKNTREIKLTEADNQEILKKSDKAEKGKRTVFPVLTIAKKIDVEDFTSWKNNKLVFKSERFEDLAVKIERWYNVEIQLGDEVLKNSVYTGVFEKETIEQAMKALCLSQPFNYVIDKNKIIVEKKN